MMTMGWDSTHHENDSLPRPPVVAWLGVAKCRGSGHHRSVDTKTRLVVALVFLIAIALIVVAGLIAVASPAK
jgi:hypothetical protein